MGKGARQRELARARAIRQEQRHAEKRARQKRALLAGTGVVISLALVFGGLGLAGTFSAAPKKAAAAAKASASVTPSSSAAASPSASASASIVPDAERPVACGAKAPKPPAKQTYAKEPALTIDTKKTYTMTIVTSCGTIVASLDAAKAPHTVNSFNFLASKHFFDGIEVSRTTGASTGFSVLQAGDQEGTGAGGPGYTIPDENLTGATYPRGRLAMANTGSANSGGSQFFILASDGSKALGPTYTPWGDVTSGLDVLDKIIALGNDGSNSAGGGHPSQRVYIDTLTVTAK